MKLIKKYYSKEGLKLAFKSSLLYASVINTILLLVLCVEDVPGEVFFLWNSAIIAVLLPPLDSSTY